jgi:hypothetical protein
VQVRGTAENKKLFAGGSSVGTVLLQPARPDGQNVDITFLFPAKGDGDVYESAPVVRSSRIAFAASKASSLGAGCRWTHEQSKDDRNQTVLVDVVGPHVAFKPSTLKSGGCLDDESMMVYTIAQHMFCAHLPADAESEDEDEWDDDDGEEA